MSYIPNGESGRKRMLDYIGVEHNELDKLFSIIPPELRASSFNLPAGKSEFEVIRHLRDLGNKNVHNLVYFCRRRFLRS